LSAAQQSAEVSLLASGDSCECLDIRWSCVDLADGSCSGTGWAEGEMAMTPEFCLEDMAIYGMGYCDAGTVVTATSELGLSAGDECSCLDIRWSCVDLDDGSCSGTGWAEGDMAMTPEFCL